MAKLLLLSKNSDIILPADEAETRATLCFLAQLGLKYEFERTRNADACSPDHLLPLGCYNGQLLTGFDALCSALEATRPQNNDVAGDNVDEARSQKSLNRVYFCWLSDTLRNVMIYFTWCHEENFKQFTLPRGKLGLPWPIYHFVLNQQRAQYNSYLSSIEWKSKTPDDVLAEVDGICLGMIELLGSGPYFFKQKSPGKLDALVCGYWSVFFEFDDIFAPVNRILEKCKPLAELVARMKDQCTACFIPVCPSATLARLSSECRSGVADLTTDHMVGEYSYCAVETKQFLKNRITVFAWSPKTDLIALGSVDGTVSVHRYKMTCIWELPLSGGSSVTCLAWRPDGKTVAASYQSGALRLFLTNDGFVYHETTVAGPVDFLNWTSIPVQFTPANVSNAGVYFPDLSSLSMFKSDPNFTSTDTFKLSQLLSDLDENLNILAVHANDGLHFYGGYSFHIASWSVQPKSGEAVTDVRFLGCHFSSCTNVLLILYSFSQADGQFSVELQQLPAYGLVANAPQLRNLSVQKSAITICKSLIDWSFSQICVSWEDMILEVDAKFTKYARDRLQQNRNWSLCVELLEFILFGNCPVPLRKFLVEDWTAPSLKRTGTATLKAYESIKTICFQQLQLLLQRLLFHSAELLGNLRDTERYKQFCMPSSVATKLCRTVGATLQKTQELHLVIEKSITHLRAFFKWLYVAILGLSGRVLPDDFPRVTPTERESVIDFITNYLQPVFDQNELHSYHVELVEQYIRPGEVKRPLEIVAEHSLAEDKERSKLRNLVNRSLEELEKGNLPAGLFHYSSSATLADLIQKELQDSINALFEVPSGGRFSRGCLDFEDSTFHLIYRGPSSPGNSLGHLSLAFYSGFRADDTISKSSSRSVAASTSTCLAWSPPHSDSESCSIVLLNLQPSGPKARLRATCVSRVVLDQLPSVENPQNLRYELRDFQFYTSDLLIMLIRRPVMGSSQGFQADADPHETGTPATNEPSWLVMLPVQDLLSSSWRQSAETLEPNSSTEIFTPSTFPVDSEISHSAQIPSTKLSELITPAHVESLPWQANRLAANGERSIVFVLFQGSCTCRVYLLERPDPDDATTEAADAPGDAPGVTEPNCTATTA
ncbi:unnamed protein product [Calicophoron daubneyi]|uniref:Anaphase-promoting complex subunit 4 n=1 Tax=Calicophoron daubneyi TaxID=300641 RepID=A0AAV2T9G9_CALDB